MKHSFTTLIARAALSAAIVSFPLQLHGQNEPISHSIESETAVTSPKDRKRKRIGVAEEVTLKLTPGHKAAWTLSGGGKINGGTEPVSGASTVKITAPNEATTMNITAVCEEDGQQASISFTVVAPTGEMHEYHEDYLRRKEPLAVGMMTEIYILPDDVNFEKIEVKEGACAAQTSGYFDYQKGKVHDAVDSWTPMWRHVEGKGTQALVNDIVSGGTKGAPYAIGTFEWMIPVNYSIGGQDMGEYSKVKQTKDLSMEEGVATLKLEKAGAKVEETNP